MAYINVAEWTASHVGDWLRGLDDSILPYTLFFVNNQINGCRLLLLTPDDLIKLNVKKIGHQEIILEAVELLKQLHYNFTSETLQTVCLRLACKSRSLHNQLKQQALSVQNESNPNSPTGPNSHDDPRFNTTDDSATLTSKSNKKDKHKDKDKDKENRSHSDLLNDPNGADKKRQSGTDMSRISTTTLFSVGDILTAVKDFICWIDRAPFDGQAAYVDARSKILKISIELASTAQRDQFVQAPNEVIKNCCKVLADISDTLVQKLNDSLAFQCAQLEVVTVIKNVQEELGMFIHSSYSGVHVVSGLKYESPAQKNGQLEEGDEIVQVNYRTVVGWQLKKLVSSMRQFPSKIILTIKKRPKHSNSGNPSLISPFSLPVHDVFCQQQQQQQSFYSMNYMQQPPPQQQQHHLHLQQHSDMDGMPIDIYRTLPNPVMPVIPIDDPNLSNVENIYNPVLYQQQQQFYHSSIAPAAPQNTVQEPNKYRSNQIYGINCEALNDKESSQNRFSKSQNEKPALVSRPVHTKKRKSRVATTRCSSASEPDFDGQDTDSDFSFSSEDDEANFSSTDDGEIKDNPCIRKPIRTIPLDSGKKAQFSGPGSTSSGTSSAIDPIICENKPAFESNESDHNIKHDDDLDDSDSAFYSIGNTNFTKRNIGTSDKNSLALSSSSDKSPQNLNTTQPIVSAKHQMSTVPEVCASSKTPRTSAEFEALYLRKECSPTKMDSNDSCDKDNEQTPILSSVHLSTISHLKSLAANIRFAANTPTSIATPAGGVPTAGCNQRATHNTSQFDEPLAMRIKSSLERLTNGDTDMGDHQDFLYIYKGREQTQNKDKTSERLPSLGPMVYDPKQDNKWTKIHATLRENCLFTNQVPSDINELQMINEKDREYQFEIPVHLPGYYILVNKTDILSTSDKKITGGDTAHGNPNTVLLYVFKLVTYHHLYLFGVESTAKLARWICKFGYRYCCNPSDSHLCFTYYLSSTHVEPKVVSTRLSLDDSHRSHSTSNNDSSQDSLSQTDKRDAADKNDENASQYSSNSNNNTMPNTESELSSDDYLDLTMHSNKSRVKFDPNLNGIKENDPFGDNDSSSSEVTDCRKFAKSPHPGARFSVKATDDCVEFVESKLAHEESEASASPVRKIPPQLPPRSSSVSAMNTTHTVSSNSSPGKNNDSLPRPRPRISKMNSSSSDNKDSAENTPKTTPTKPVLPPKGPFLNSSNDRTRQTSSPVNRPELTPISVPEKSAAISQTIQHFANLQRQNVLRRSNQQMMRAAEKAEKERMKSPMKSANAQSPCKERPETPKREVAVQNTVQTLTSADYDYIVSKSPSKSDVKSIESSPVGNPLYHSIASITTPLQQQNQQMALVLPDVVSSSSSNSDSQDSPPPPTSLPPPAPPVVRECVLKPSSLFAKFEKLSLEEKNKENIELPESSVDCDFQVFNMNGKILNSPKISPRRPKNPAPLPEESPKELPPILPRRSNIPKKTPPPIPTTAHPLKSNRPSIFTFETPPEVSRTEAPSSVLTMDMPTLLPVHKPIISAKSLNRSFSDAYAKSPNGRVRPRKSLESGLPLNALLDDEDQNSPDIGLPYNRQYFGANTPTSPAQLVAGSSTSDLNNSNRSLPTMGVSMLGKKRLSNVSADCYAIKEALNLFENSPDWSSSRKNSLTATNRP